MEFGRIMVSPTGPYLPEVAVEQGWLKLRENLGHNEYSEEAHALLEKLRALEAQAKSQAQGLWQPSLGIIEIDHDLPDSQAFLEQWKGHAMDGRV